MIFKTKKLTNNVSLVYGFKDEKDVHYYLVTTLQKKDDSTIVHGLISKGEMHLFEFISLWEYYKKIVTTPYIKFEVLPDHARFYKLLLPTEECIKSKTFNGLDCEVLKINIKSKLKHFAGG